MASFLFSSFLFFSFRSSRSRWIENHSRNAKGYRGIGRVRREARHLEILKPRSRWVEKRFIDSILVGRLNVLYARSDSHPFSPSLHLRLRLRLHLHLRLASLPSRIYDLEAYRYMRAYTYIHMYVYAYAYAYVYTYTRRRVNFVHGYTVKGHIQSIARYISTAAIIVTPLFGFHARRRAVSNQTFACFAFPFHLKE